MKAGDQGVRERGHRRYQAIPRSLVFLTSANPESGEREVLLLKGAPNKRLWAGKFNGIGGHVEANEDVHTAAVREVAEETGLTVDRLDLRAVVNIDTGFGEDGARPGVLMFVFVGQTAHREVIASDEGELIWGPVADPLALPLVDDLYELLPRVLGSGPLLFGHYFPDSDGTMIYRFND